MINLALSNKEWYFLHVQLEKLVKENPNNHIAKGLFEKLIINLPMINDIKSEFQKEYDCVWIGDAENMANEQ